MFLSMPSLLSWSTEFPATGWLHGLVLVGALVLLEAVLSADNAVALASLVRHVEPEEERQRILNWGLVMALVLRALTVAAAGLVVHLPLVRLVGGGYLIWLAASHFQREFQGDEARETVSGSPQSMGMVLLVGLTDLAFSLDSVSAAVAVTDQLVLVVLAGAMGVLLLRFMAGWMLAWMERFPNLQNAGYLTVLTVGLRLAGEVIAPALVPAEPILLAVVLLLFSWGFSGARVSES